ncbi:MAG: hypothetical protein WC428_06555 [Candidatus Paceibacterota bacterium]
MTDLLVKELSHKVTLPDGSEVPGKKLIAQNIVAAVTTGKIRFPKDSEDSVISVKDWIDFMKWLYVHVDGQAKNALDDIADNGLRVIVEYENGQTNITSVSSEPTRDT